MVRIKKLLLVLCFTLTGACSSTFLYNQLDWLVPWYVDDYVDLSREQNQHFKAQLLPVLEWHRSEELQSYLPILDSIESDLSIPITADAIRKHSEELLAAFERIQARALPLVFDLGEKLNDVQIAEFIANLYEEQAELEKEYLTRDENDYIEDSYDNLADNMDDLMGRLSKEQKQGLKDTAARLRRFDSAWLEERRDWLQQMEIILQREEGWQERLSQAMSSRQELRSATYTDAFDYNQNVIFEGVAELVQSRSEKQDARLRRELAGFRSDILELIAERD